ncbi:MAG: energy transducer TonB [Verrucomicrobia bacterium]|nr:energy transducer TonB [Verrucomicrobiota bacterium]
MAAPAVSSPSSLAAVSRPALAPAFLPPQFRVRVEPTYPERARRAGVEGRVTVRLHISAAGEVVAADVATSSGSASLDAAALLAAQASRFTPARAEAGAVPSDATATYRFELK